jgi:hypothetical protein
MITRVKDNLIFFSVSQNGINLFFIKSEFSLYWSVLWDWIDVSHCLVAEQTDLVHSGQRNISCLEQISPEFMWSLTISAKPLMNAGWILGAGQRLIFSIFNYQNKLTLN